MKMDVHYVYLVRILGYMDSRYTETPSFMINLRGQFYTDNLVPEISVYAHEKHVIHLP